MSTGLQGMSCEGQRAFLEVQPLSGNLLGKLGARELQGFYIELQWQLAASKPTHYFVVSPSRRHWGNPPLSRHPAFLKLQLTSAIFRVSKCQLGVWRNDSAKAGFINVRSQKTTGPIAQQST